MLFRIVNFLVENGNVIVKNCVEIDEISRKQSIVPVFLSLFDRFWKLFLVFLQVRSVVRFDRPSASLSLLLLRDLAVDGGRGRCRDKDSNVTLIDRARQIHRRTDGTDGRV